MRKRQGCQRFSPDGWHKGHGQGHCDRHDNRIGNIDHAMLRPGRFDKIVEVPSPDKVGRMDIFKTLQGEEAGRKP